MLGLGGGLSSLGVSTLKSILSLEERHRENQVSKRAEVLKEEVSDAVND